MRKAVLGLGSNVGDRAGYLARAEELLAADDAIEVLARGGTYETVPVGGPPQGDYLNSAILVATELAPRDLLERALAAEAKLGRRRTPGERNAPRTIDVDVLFIEGEALAEEGLIVPHPRLSERAFALRPLLDVLPDAADPRSGARFAEMPAARVPLRRI